MTCREIEEQEFLERYVLGRLTDSERDAFEQHYFECDSCFEQLQTGIVMQEDLRQALVRQRLRRVFFGQVKIWVPAFAALAFFAFGFWWYTGRRSQSQAASSSAVGSPPVSISKPSGPAPSIDELARAEAPPYSEVVVRGPEDNADIIFRKAMQHYLKHDYAGAIPGLGAAVKASPSKAQFSFYLGSCYLITDQTEAAIRSLRKVTSLDDPSYSEPAHFYLAKAYLRNHDVSHAEAELRIAAKPGGSRAADAAEILHQLRK